MSKKAKDLLRDFEKDSFKALPAIEIGDTLKLTLRIKEGERTRLQVYEGTVISRHRAGIQSTITVRRIFQGIGIERVFPLYSPQITDIKIIRQAVVRRAKLYYLRQRQGKAARLKTKIKR